MVKFLTDRPIAVIMTLVAFLSVGVVSFFRVPVSLLPDINIPEITVQVSYPNTGAGQLENAVIKPMRNSLLQVNHLTEIESNTRDNSATIRMKFSFSADIHLAYIEISEMVDRMMGSFPKDMPRPQVVRASASDIPVFYLSIVPGKTYWDKNNDLLELSDYANNVLKRRIEQLPEVAMVDISGYETPEIIIKPRPEKLSFLDIDEGDIENALVQNTVEFGNFIVDEKHFRYHIRFSGRTSTVEDLGEIPMKAGDRLLKLKDIADITVTPAIRRGMYLYGNREAIVMAVIKQSDAQLSKMRGKLLTLTEQIRKENPGLEFFITNDSSHLLEYSIGNLKQTLWLGLLLAVAIMFFFVRDVKSPLVVGTSIPVSLTVSILFLYLSGISINVVSLSGLILGVGMMIDNSIIVIDNINQYIRQGKTTAEACVAGTNEVIRPLISSVLTTCAVFVPLVFLSDIAGALFFEQAVAIAVSLTVSLFVSIMALPVFYLLAHGKTAYAKQVGEWKAVEKIETAYYRQVSFILRKKTLILLFFIALIPAGILLFGFIKKQFLPTARQNEIIAEINWNEPIHIEENRSRVISLTKGIDSQLTSQSAFLGRQQFILQGGHKRSSSEASINFSFRDDSDLPPLENELRERMRLNYPFASLDFKPAKNIFNVLFSGNENFVMAKIRPAGESGTLNMDTIENLAARINESSDIRAYCKLSKNTVHRISIDFEKMMLYKIGYHNIIEKLQSVFNNYRIGQLSPGNGFIDIFIGGEDKSLHETLQNMAVRNADGEMMLLGRVVTHKVVTDFSGILADKQGMYFPVQVRADYGSLAKTEASLRNLVTGNTSYMISFSGGLYENLKLFRELAVVLLISVLLLYLILAAQFESLKQPLIVLLEILFDFSGALLILMLFGSSLNIMSAIGMIIMSGIVINDSIIKIDTINLALRSGSPLIEAIHTGGSRRLKPIIMTSLTTILALFPLLFFQGLGVELQLPLALAIMGGLALGTAVSLYFIPLMYYLLYRKSAH
ncbi:MAG: efflux RND transporter permease subunit [Bacteroidales bacterium]|nr:efflux RND transporter permease subunit [Bacteroidales bacterium]